MQTPYTSYLEDEILTADPLTLVKLLYRAAIEAIERARGHFDRGEIAPRSRQIAKAVSILQELSLSLDHKRGGELSRNLVELYDYAIRELLQANSTQNAAPLARVLDVLRPLAEAWESCASGSAAAPAPQRKVPVMPSSIDDYEPVRTPLSISA